MSPTLVPFSATMKSSPRSLAVPAAIMPALPAPMMRRSVSRVATMSASATVGSSPSQ
ncbi:hypothetical protein [Adlercreutzia caecimuris]|uniref:hypothetical protein n=1 Tax=Adlercreutzia caecimuris TaxID=671266 RepID=UPI00272D4CC7|nr:hypothetical protein [Adlercreutzia caecimuris]